MIDLSGPIRIAIAFYGTNITIQDTTYTATSGEDVQALSGTARTVFAAVDSSSKQTMEYLFGGSVSDGDVMLYCYSSTTLYIDDMHSPSAIRKQSFYIDGSNYYRITSIADWANPTGMKIYLAKRHIAQKLI